MNENKNTCAAAEPAENERHPVFDHEPLSDDRMIIERFGEIIDEALTAGEVLLQIHSEAGSEEYTVESNLVAGTLEFYVVLNGMEKTLTKLLNEMGGKDSFDVPALLDDILELVKSDVLDALGDDERSGS